MFNYFVAKQLYSIFDNKTILLEAIYGSLIVATTSLIPFLMRLYNVKKLVIYSRGYGRTYTIDVHRHPCSHIKIVYTRSCIIFVHLCICGGLIGPVVR